MNNQDRLGQLLDQIADFIKQIKECENRPLNAPINKETEQLLSRLEYEASLLTVVQEKMFTQAGITDQEVQDMMKGGEDATAKAQYFFDRAQLLKRDALEIHTNITRMINLKDKQVGKKDEKEVGKAREKKFKRVGAKKGWIPM